MAEEVIGLQNRIAELEDEKGNLQLRLVEMDDALTAQGDTPQLSLLCLTLSPACSCPFCFAQVSAMTVAHKKKCSED